jgi:hypothetical protein
MVGQGPVPELGVSELATWPKKENCLPGCPFRMLSEITVVRTLNRAPLFRKNLLQ